MPQANIPPWWIQYLQGQGLAPAPSGTPTITQRNGMVFDDQGRPIEGATMSSQTPKGNPNFVGPPATPFSPTDPNIEPSPLPQTAEGYPLQYNASDYPTQVGQGLMMPPQAGGGAETLGQYYNPPVTDTGGSAPAVDQYQYPNPPPDESMVAPQTNQYLYNPPPNDNATPPQTQSYYGGGFNPQPNEGMLPNEAPIWQQPDLTNPPPDESMVASPVSEPSGLSLSGMPDFSLGGTLPQQNYNYFPDGQGGYVAYDSNWNPIEHMPGVQTPDPSQAFSISDLPGGNVPLQDSSTQIASGGTDTGSALGSNFQTINAMGFDPSQPQSPTDTQQGQSFTYGSFPTFYDVSGPLGGGIGAGSYAGWYAGASPTGLGVHGNYAEMTDPIAGSYFGGGSGGRGSHVS